MFCKVKSCVLVINKSVIKIFYFHAVASGQKTNTLHCFLQRKSHLVQSGKKFAQIKHCSLAKTAHNKSKQIRGGFWCERTQEEALLWIMDFSQKQWFNVKKATMMDLFLRTHRFSLHKMLINGLGLCILLLVYCDVFFISFLNLWHPFPEEAPLVSDVMLHFCKCEIKNEETNSFTSRMT